MIHISISVSCSKNAKETLSGAIKDSCFKWKTFPSKKFDQICSQDSNLLLILQCVPFFLISLFCLYDSYFSTCLVVVLSCNASTAVSIGVDRPCLQCFEEPSILNSQDLCPGNSR